MNDSKIFTNAELEALNQRFEGSRKDVTGIFSARVKPKILELLIWFNSKKELQKVIGQE